MRRKHMPWWGWLIVGGGLLVWVSIVAFVCMFFKGAKRLNDKWDREHEEFVRRNFGGRRG
jgi:hypothetical protein